MTTPPPVPPNRQQPAYATPDSAPKTSQVKVLVIVLACVGGGLLLLVLLGVAILYPALNRSREFANRIKCGNNLRTIGQSMMLYVGMDTRLQSLPRVKFVGGTNPSTTWGTGGAGPFQGDPDNAYRPSCGVQPNDVTALLYHAMATTNAMDTQTFVCPACKDTPWDQKNVSVDSFVNWSAQAGSPNDYHTHLSYSVQNPYCSDKAISMGFDWKAGGSCQRTDFALAADMNPGPGPKTAVGSNALAPQMTYGPQSSSPSSMAQTRGANSPNHGGEGQNVLYGDGHVDWCASPWCGVSDDNIYTYRKSSPRSGPGTCGPGDQALSAKPGDPQSPYDADDSILLPTRE